jgi:quercetin dioxygenase-like cupin family protein
MTTMPETYAAKRTLLAELCRPLLLDVATNGRSTPLILRTDFQFAPLPEAPGFELARLLSPDGFSATLLRGQDGAHSPRFATPHAVRVEVLVGSLYWWQESLGEPGEPDAHRKLTRGDVIHLAPNEPHTYRALSMCLTYNVFSPAAPEHAHP